MPLVTFPNPSLPPSIRLALVQAWALFARFTNLHGTLRRSTQALCFGTVECVREAAEERASRLRTGFDSASLYRLPGAVQARAVDAVSDLLLK